MIGHLYLIMVSFGFYTEKDFVFIHFLLELFDYLKQNKTNSILLKQQISDVYSTDSNLLSTQSNNLFSKLHRWIEFLHDPIFNITIRCINLKYKSP